MINIIKTKKNKNKKQTCFPDLSFESTNLARSSAGLLSRRLIE